METNYQKWLDEASSNIQAIKKKANQIKRKKTKQADQQFSELHHQAFQEIDCLKCANCCKTTSPIFRDIDIRRIASHLRITESKLIGQYLRMDEDGDYVLTQSPCHFLLDDNTCSIYEHRPLACREYPHTNRKNMYQIMDLTVKNTEICPAVARVLLEISK